MSTLCKLQNRIIYKVHMQLHRNFQHVLNKLKLLIWAALELSLVLCDSWICRLDMPGKWGVWLTSTAPAYHMQGTEFDAAQQNEQEAWIAIHTKGCPQEPLWQMFTFCWCLCGQRYFYTTSRYSKFLRFF